VADRGAHCPAARHAARQPVADSGEPLPPAREHLARYGVRVPREEREGLLDGLVPRVEVVEGPAETAARIALVLPAVGRRTRVQGVPVRRARGEERRDVREVGVDGVALDARAVRDRAHRRAARADRRVQVDGGLHDPPPRLLGAFRALLQLVLPLHCTTVYLET